MMDAPKTEVIMPLNIIKPSEPISVGPLCIVIYGSPGVGKTMACCTAGRTLLFDFDGGFLRSRIREQNPPLPVDVVQPQRWSDVSDVRGEDIEPYDTVVIDTIGRMQDMLGAHIISEDPRMSSDGTLNLRGFGRLKGIGLSWLSKIRLFGKDLVIIAHVDEQKKNDDVVERLYVQGAMKNELHLVAHAMGVIRMTSRGRTLTFDPTETAYGKNPARLPVLHIPEPDGANGAFRTFMGSVIGKIRAAMQQDADAFAASAKDMDSFLAELDECITDSDFTRLVGKASELGVAAKRVLIAKARDNGLHFDKEAGKFVCGK